MPGSLAKDIGQYFGIKSPEEFNSPEWWPLIAEGKKEADGFHWKLKRNVVAALDEMDVFNDDKVFPEEDDVWKLKYLEGAVKTITVA